MAHITGHKEISTFEQTPEQKQAAFEAAGIPLPSVDEAISSDVALPSPTLTVQPEEPLAVADTAILTSKTFITPSGAEVTEEGELTTPPPLDDFTTQLESILGEVGGRDREDEVSVRTQEEQRRLIEINKQIQLSQAQALEAQNLARERGETLGFASLEQQKEARLSAIEAIRLSATAQAIQGNLALANQLAGRAVDEEFKEREREIQRLRNNIIANFDSFTASEKKRALRTLARLDADGVFLKEQKEVQRGISTEALTAAGLGATNLQLEDIRNSADQIEARQKRIGFGFEEVDTGFTLSEGQVRFDAQGNVIARGGGQPGIPGVSGPQPTENVFDLGLDVGEGDIVTRNGRQFVVDPIGDLIPTGTGGDLSALTPFEAQGLEFRLGRQAFGSRISDKEGEKVSRFVQSGIAAGKNENDILDTILGFNVKKNEPLGRALQEVLIGFGAENGLADFDMVGLARLLNSDNTVAAMTKVENSGMKEALKLNPDGFISEATTVAATDRSGTLRELIEGLENSPIGVASGTMESWLGRLRGEDATAIGTKIVSAVAEMRKRLLGSAVTPTENVFLAPKVPILGDSPANFMIKLLELETDPLLQLNSIRGTIGLPLLTKDTLLDKKQRVGLYEFGDIDFAPQGGTLGTEQSFDLSDLDFKF